MARAIPALVLYLSMFAPSLSGALPPVLWYNDTLFVPRAGANHPVPSGIAGERGYSLGELFPPQLEAWKLKLTTTATTRTINADNLGECLYGIYVIETGSGWDVILDTSPGSPVERIRSVSSLSLYGEPCPEKSIEVWVSWEGVADLKALVRSWAANAGVSVKVVDVPSIKSKLITVLRGGGKLPDLVMVQSDYLPDLVDAGALQSLDALWLPEVDSKGRKAFELGGSLMAAPFYCDTQLVFYSTRLIRLAPDSNWTLADMERMARASGAQVGAAWNAYSAYWFLPFVIGFGKPEIIMPDGRMNVTHPAYEKALAFLKDSESSGFLSAMERDAMMAYFTSGKAAFILSGSYSIPEFRRLGLEFDIAPFPLVTAGGKRVAPLLDYKGWAVTKGTKSPVLARRLAQYLSGAAVQASFCAPLGKLPANARAWDLMSTDKRYEKVVRTSYADGIAVPPDPAYGTFKNASWKLVRLYLGGSMSARETLEALATIMGE